MTAVGPASNSPLLHGVPLAVCQRQLAPFTDRSGRFRRDMTRDAIRPGELPKQPLQPVSAALDIRISLGLGAYEIAMRYQPRTAMTGADDIDHVTNSVS
jgi:hypothetical protein